MSDPRVADMSFRDYLSNALVRLGDAEAAYNRLIEGADTRDEVTNLLADAAIAITLGSSRALADAVDLSRAARGELGGDLLEPEPFSVWPEAHDLVFPVAGPQEDREDQLVREIDETGQDWNRAAEEDDQ